jgi:hypothetical protein
VYVREGRLIEWLARRVDFNTAAALGCRLITGDRKAGKQQGEGRDIKRFRKHRY